jgi:hypothetical protein
MDTLAEIDTNKGNVFYWPPMAGLTLRCWTTNAGVGSELFKLPNNPYRGCRKRVQFGSILFTPIPLTAKTSCTVGPLEVRASLWCQYFPPLSLLTIATTTIYMTQHSATTHFSHMTNKHWQASYMFTACTGVKCWSNINSGLWDEY